MLRVISSLKRVREFVLLCLIIRTVYWLWKVPAPVIPQGKQGRPNQLDWQPVAGSSFPFSVYSAYAFIKDSSPPSEVIIVTTGHTRHHDPVRCKFYFWNETDNTSNVQRIAWRRGTSRTAGIGPELTYAGVFVRCPLPHLNGVLPHNVSVVIDKKQAEITNVVPINYKYELPENTSYQHTFSVCVLPAYNFNDFLHLIEWTEFYKLMGVDHFTLYNMSMGSDTSCMLHDLMETNGSVKFEVHPWHNNPVNNTLEPNGGPCGGCVLSAGHNDCLYKHRGRVSKYMVFVDFDEYITPQSNTTRNYSEMISHLDSTNPTKKIGEYRFRNAFFVRSRPSDPKILERCASFKDKPLHYRVCQEAFMMNKVERDAYHSYFSRTKYIMKPEGVQETGNHWVARFEDGYSKINVPESIAYLRHYRHFDQNPTSHTDRIPLEFGIALVNNIAEKVDYYMKKCNVTILH